MGMAAECKTFSEKDWKKYDICRRVPKESGSQIRTEFRPDCRQGLIPV